jgi:hypothetical protein
MMGAVNEQGEEHAVEHFLLRQPRCGILGEHHTDGGHTSVLDKVLWWVTLLDDVESNYIGYNIDVWINLRKAGVEKGRINPVPYLFCLPNDKLSQNKL